MRKFLLFLTILACCVPLKAQPNYGTNINDCKRKTGCSFNNNYNFGGGRRGARLEFDYIKCSTNTNIGNAVHVCVNNDPLKPPEQRVTNCNFDCPENAFGWGYTTVDGVDHEGTVACNSCPTPSPTPMERQLFSGGFGKLS